MAQHYWQIGTVTGPIAQALLWLVWVRMQPAGAEEHQPGSTIRSFAAWLEQNGAAATARQIREVLLCAPP